MYICRKQNNYLKNIMKKFAFLFVFALAGSLFFSSCSNSDDDTTAKPRPSISWKGGAGFTSTDASVPAGNTFDFGITAASTSGENITRVRVTTSVNGGTASILSDSTLKEKTVSIDWIGINVGSLPNAKIRYTITVTQSNGESSSVGLTITVTPTPKNVQTRSNIQMGAQTNPTLGSFFDFTTQNILLLGAANLAPASIDFIFYSGTGGSVFAAPDSDNTPFPTVKDNWATRNNTRFRRTTLTAAQFDAIADGTASTPIDNEATSGAFTSDVKLLKVGDVIVFITAGGQEFGLLKVSAITAGGAGSITFDLKFGS